MQYYLPTGDRILVSTRSKHKTLAAQKAKHAEKRLLAGEFTDEEQAFLRRYRFWRSLWIFNPKRRRRV